MDVWEKNPLIKFPAVLNDSLLIILLLVAANDQLPKKPHAKVVPEMKLSM